MPLTIMMVRKMMVRKMMMMMKMKTYLNVNIVKTREDNITRMYSSRSTYGPMNYNIHLIRITIMMMIRN